MGNTNLGSEPLNKLINDIKLFIKMSLREEDVSYQKWVDEVSDSVDSFCHEVKDCDNKDCIAYKSECGRCWLQVGTLCGGEVQGQFADKVELCTDCEVFKGYVGDDQTRYLRELILTLIHSLSIKRQELKKAITEIKTLKGFIPICSSCKQIRDDQGYWQRLESYITKHSDAEFTHSYCPECIHKLYPEIAEEVIREINQKSQTKEIDN